jgi:segregation and condensation protein A
MAYKVNLETFKGPLDLLVHLIKKEEVDIYNIPIARVLDQYMDYVRVLEMMDMDLSGDFLVMASTLMFIKSKMLLPLNPSEEEEEDPRDKLVQQLLEYKTFKEIALMLEEKEAHQKNVFDRGGDDRGLLGDKEIICKVGIFDLMGAFQEVFQRKEEDLVYKIIQEEIEVEACIANILEVMKREEEVDFLSLFDNIHSRIYLITMFLALLELIRLREIIVLQLESFAPITLKKTAPIRETKNEDSMRKSLDQTRVEH